MMQNSNQVSTKQSKNERIEVFLRERYQFRYNTVKCRTEYRAMDSNTFCPVTKFFLNSIRRELDSSTNISTSSENIRTILESNFSESVNPIHHYFRNLPPAYGREKIHELASTVIVKNEQHWDEYLTKWLTAVVANAINDSSCCNHTCLVFTGEQGKFKTTWLDYLCPSSLKSYLFTGKIDPQSKDVQSLLSEYLLINIDDQLKALNKRDENELKALITCPSVKYRRPYDVYIEEHPHRASFVASVNGIDFLTDSTGSRRFLPFEVISIDISATQTIDMDAVYSEVMTLVNSGYRYWFNDSEIEELHRQSAGFHVQTIEYELLLGEFARPIENAPDCFMTTAQIMSYLKTLTTLHLSEKRMGEALRKAGYQRKSKRVDGNPVYGWTICRAAVPPI